MLGLQLCMQLVQLVEECCLLECIMGSLLLLTAKSQLMLLLLLLLPILADHLHHLFALSRSLSSS